MYLHQEEIVNEARKVLYQRGYDDMKPIGDGGYATIYKVRSRQYQDDFVVKLIDLTLDESSNNIMPTAFKTEIDALTHLDHPNVIRIFDQFTTNTLLYIILEYCPGGSLKDIIVKNGFIPPPVLFDWCRQIINALYFCHQHGIAHRDVKPSNILIDKYSRAKLADFGLAQLYQMPKYSSKDESNDTNNSQNSRKKHLLSNIFGGSLPYLPPEILYEKLYDPFKADVWSLGATFYEMATGKLPWDPPGGMDPENLIEMMNQPAYSPLLKLNKSTNPDFIKALSMMLTMEPNSRCSLPSIMNLPIFQKQKTKALNKDSSVFQRRSFKSLSARCSSGRNSCIYSSKRSLPIGIVHTFQSEESEEKKQDEEDYSLQYLKS
ncbi:hypothetical protein M9Y10_016445 [Tritrichomonas musculus]|uniref:Protein kinase domain-containing protein n=1 Tax=Tritrichomonas musculus TaxID=1915356 RepID=A0ABR2HW98_9EUKA